MSPRAEKPPIMTADVSAHDNHKESNDLQPLFDGWLADKVGTLAANTIETWRSYTKAHWLPFFVDASGLTYDRFAEYMRMRLGHVLKVTVKKERTALKGFLEWSLRYGGLTPPPHADPRPTNPEAREQWAGDVVSSWVPKLPKRGLGTNYKHRRRVGSFDITPEQAKAILRELPEWSTSRRVGRFPVRARFILAYETSLRPSTLDRLRAPKHYRIGSDELQLSPEIDKARFGREVPLSKRARRVLDYLLRTYERETGKPFEGLIFGAHDYRQHLKKAAARALPPQKAEKWAGSHLRAHRITHLLENGANVPGVQWLAGHKQLATTSKYSKASERAAVSALEKALPKKRDLPPHGQH
jgi:integrase